MTQGDDGMVFPEKNFFIIRHEADRQVLSWFTLEERRDLGTSIRLGKIYVALLPGLEESVGRSEVPPGKRESGPQKSDGLGVPGPKEKPLKSPPRKPSSPEKSITSYYLGPHREKSRSQKLHGRTGRPNTK